MDEQKKWLIDEQELLSPSKNIFEAAAFYERHVDRLVSPNFYDKDYPEFPWLAVRHICQSNRQIAELKGVAPYYSQRKFHELVAQYFNTTIAEMNQHWKSFK